MAISRRLALIDESSMVINPSSAQNKTKYEISCKVLSMARIICHSSVSVTPGKMASSCSFTYGLIWRCALRAMGNPLCFNLVDAGKEDKQFDQYLL
nr:hypothetical protein [Nitrosomonas ureae]